MSMRYTLAIFDFDGTLADSYPWFASVANDVADKFRFRRIAPDEFDELRGKSASEVIARLGVSRWKLPFIAYDMRKRKARDIDRIALFPGAREALHRLRAEGVALAIVSSNAEANIRAVLGRDAALIAHYACGASMFGKAAKFKAVLRASGHDATDAISIGDEIRDMDASRVAGIAFAALAWGYTHADALRTHDAADVFETFDELTAHVLGHDAAAVKAAGPAA